MRVISGRFRGRTLLSPVYKGIRPTGDMVKEAIFASLSVKNLGARCLDLFAGSGALGIEAISRGAGEVIFVDKSHRSVTLTIRNLKLIGAEAKVLLKDAMAALKSFDEPFDIIFLDPPYKSELYGPALEIIFERKLLKEDGIIVCEHEKKTRIKTDTFMITSQKNYGTVGVTYLTEKKFE